MRECVRIVIKEGESNRRACEQALRDAGYTGLIISEWERGDNSGRVVVYTRAKIEASKLARLVADLGDTVISATVVSRSD